MSVEFIGHYIETRYMLFIPIYQILDQLKLHLVSTL